MLNNETIREAVKLWLEDKESAIAEYGHISHWDTSEVTDMSKLFLDANDFNDPIENWNTSNVTDMSAMFDNAFTFNQPLDKWDTSQVTDMGEMFSTNNEQEYAFNQPIGNWNVSNVTNMRFMFFRARSFNQPLENWDVSNVRSMEGMFSRANTFNQPINKWDTSQVSNLSQMFKYTPFNQPIGNWDVSNVHTMAGMFLEAHLFNQPLDRWDTSNVTNMYGMFWNAKSFNQPLEDWDVGNVLSMEKMFYGARLFNQPLNKWKVNNDCWTEDFGSGSGIIDNPFDLDERGEYEFDGWDEDFIVERVEEKPIWHEGQDNGKTLFIFFTIAGIRFSDHPRIAILGDEALNNFVDFKEKYEKCLRGRFNMPEALKNHIKVTDYEFDISYASMIGIDNLTLELDTDCEVTFEITSSLEKAITAIDEYQRKNHDLRYNVGIYWSEDV